MPSVTLNSHFNGLNITQTQGFVPPDTQGAAGSGSTYIQTVNQTLAIYNKNTGAMIGSTDNFDNFLYTQGGLTQTDAGSTLSDPIIVWDDQIGRFIVGDQDVDFTTHVSNFDIAVSKSADPATLTAADWNFFQVSTTETIAGGHNDDYDADYPGNFGYNHDVFVFTLNMFGTGDNGLTATNHVQVNAIDIAALTAPTPSLVLNQKDVNDFSLRPTVMHDSVAGDPMWLISEAGDGQNIHVVRMDNPDVPALTAFNTFTVAVNPYSGAVPPQDPGGIITNNSDSRIMKAAERNNLIVASHAVSNAAGDRDLARWYEIDVSNPNSPTIKDQGDVTDAASGAGSAGVYDAYPTVDINAAGSIGMTYMQSGTSQDMSAYDTGRLSVDPAGTMEAPVLVQAGGGANTDTREGDMSAINTDADGSFWATTEWTDASSNWNDVASHFTVMAPYTTDVNLTNGNLVITDIAPGGKNDDLTISLNGANVRVFDPNASLEPHPGETAIDIHTIDVPLASITGNIQVNTLAGDDSLTIDASNGNPIPAGGLAYDGGSGTNTLALTVGTNTWNITGTDSGNTDGGLVTFTNVQDLVGGSGNDNFIFAAAGSVAAIDGGAGSNTITGPNQAETWNITGSNAGNVSGLVGSFTNIRNLAGGSGADDFVFAAAGALTGAIDGGAGSDTLDFSAKTTAQNVTLTGLGPTDGFSGTEASVGGGFTNIDAVIGSATATPQTLTGANLTATWTIGGSDTYASGGHTLTFSNFQDLTGGTGADDFVVTAGATFGGAIDGGAGVNTLTGPDQNATWNVTGADSGNIAGGVVASFKNIQNLTGGSGNDDFVIAEGGSVTGVIDGGPGVNTLTGPNQNETWHVTGANAGNITGVVASFKNIQNLTGGSGADDFVFSNGATLSGTVDGGAGSDKLDLSAYLTATNATLTGLGATDGYAGTVAGVTAFTDLQTLTGSAVPGNTLTGANADATWSLTSGGDSYAEVGSGQTLAFSNFDNLTGGSGADDFVFADGVTFSGKIDGGAGADTLDFSAYTTAQNVTLTALGPTDGFAGTAAAVGGGFTNIDALIGSATATPQTLTGTNLAATWTIGVGGADSYAAGGHTLAFSNYQDLLGGTGADDFVVTAGATFAGVIDGGGGVNTLTGPDQNATWNVTGANSGNIAGGVVASFKNIQNLTGGSGADDFVIAVGGSISGVIDGGGGSNTLTGPNQNETWNVTAANAGNLTGVVTSFINIQNLTGGSGADDFVFSNGATLGGTVDGGAGSDKLDLSAYTTATSAMLTGLGATDGYAGTVAGVTGFTDLQTLTGSAVAGSTLTGLNGDATWSLGVGGKDSYTEVGSGQTLAFSNFDNLTGGSGKDDFVFADGVTVNGMIDGGAGSDTLDFSAVTTAQNVTLTGLGGTDGFAGTEAAISGGFTNIDQVIGSATATPQTLTGTNLDAVWTLGVGGADTYAVGANTLAFSNYQNLTGGSGKDDFVVATGATFGGVIDGGGGSNTLTGPNQNTVWNVTGTNSGNITGVVASFVRIENLVGNSAPNTFVLGPSGVLTGVINGGVGGGNTLIGPNRNVVWDLTGPNAGAVQGAALFINIQNLTGGTAADDFVFSNGATISGVLDGGAGGDSLDFSASTTAPGVQLTGLGATDGFAGVVAAIGGGFTDIEGLVGQPTSVLVGLNVNSAWFIAAGGAEYQAAGRVLTFQAFGTIDGGAAINSFVVSGLSAALTLNGGGGGLFYVTNVTAVAALLTVEGGPAGEQLVVDDTGGLAGRTVTVTADSIGAAPTDSLFGPGGLLTYASMQAVTFLGGPFGNTINLLSKTPDSALTLDAGAGDDVVNVYVSSQSGYVNVLVDGQGGADGLRVVDVTGGAVIKNLAAGPGFGDVTACYAAGAQSFIDYQNVAAVVFSQSADAGYIQALFHEFLHRDAAPSEVNAWVGVLEATGNRSLVVDAIVQSPEARDVLVRGWYVQFLRRAAFGGEEMSFVNQLLQGQTEESVLSDLLASGEYYARAGGTDAAFVQQLSLDTLGRPPSAAEMFSYEQVIRSRTGRGGLAFALLTSAEARGEFVTVLYADELERIETAPAGVRFPGLFGPGLPSPEEIQGWVFSGLDFTKLREAFAATPEFYNRIC